MCQLPLSLCPVPVRLRTGSGGTGCGSGFPISDVGCVTGGGGGGWKEACCGTVVVGNAVDVGPDVGPCAWSVAPAPPTGRMKTVRVTGSTSVSWVSGADVGATVTTCAGSNAAHRSP